MTPLDGLVRAMIDAHGPIDLAQLMALTSAHPEHGYYPTRDPLGTSGDFVTAPEISQLFGELVGLAMVQAWLDRGAPDPSCLVELGPGRGTLMADALRAGRVVPGFLDAVRLHLVETSPALRAAQAARLERFSPRWHDSVDGLPNDLPLLIVANEFLDALPIRQLERRREGWRERRLGCDGAGRLGLVLDRKLVPVPLDAADGAVLEVAPSRDAVADELGRRLAVQGGVAVIIDYGDRREPPLGDTLQAVRGHAKVDPFTCLGSADLTSHVAFAPLARAAMAQGALAWGPVEQGTYLRRLGIEARLARLDRARPEASTSLRQAVARLIEADGMGSLFKVLALAGDDLPPPGFLADERFA